jgi:hypothetical protein
MTKRNTGVLWSVTQSLNADEKKIAQDNMGLDTLYSSANSEDAGKYVKRVYRDSNGKIVTVQSDTISTFTYSDPSSAPINGVGVKAAIDSITVKVDDDTVALNRLMVTSKNNDTVLGESFYSGLKKVSPSGHSEYSYVSVNCGEGLYISSSSDVGTRGELRLSEATSSTYGGIKIGYSSFGDYYAVELDPVSKQAYVNVPTSTLVDEVTCSHDSVGDLRTDPDRTITYLHQATNGQLSATFSDISITFAKVHPETSSSYVDGELVNLSTAVGGKLVPASIVAASKNSSAPSRTSGPVTGDKIMFCYGTSPEYWYSSTSTLSIDQSKTTEFLGHDGTWRSIPTASSSTIGGIRIGYTQSGKNYPVQLSNNQAYVNVPWTDDDTKNTVGVKSTTINTNSSAVFPFVTTVSGDNQESYAQVSGSNLLAAKKVSNGYQFTLGGKTIPFMGSSITANALLKYDSSTTSVVASGGAGNSTTPIYLNSNGVPTQCSLPAAFTLTEGVYSAKPEASTMSLTCSSTDVGASIHLFSASGAYRYWPSNPSSTNPIGYLAPTFASTDAGKVLGIDDNGAVKWVELQSALKVTFGVTTYNEVQAAYNAGKIVYLDRAETNASTRYFLKGYNSATLVFRPLASNSYNEIELTVYGWSTGPTHRLYDIDISGTYGNNVSTIYLL